MKSYDTKSYSPFSECPEEASDRYFFIEQESTVSRGTTTPFTPFSMTPDPEFAQAGLNLRFRPIYAPTYYEQELLTDARNRANRARDYHDWYKSLSAQIRRRTDRNLRGKTTSRLEYMFSGVSSGMYGDSYILTRIKFKEQGAGAAYLIAKFRRIAAESKRLMTVPHICFGLNDTQTYTSAVQNNAVPPAFTKHLAEIDEAYNSLLTPAFFRLPDTARERVLDFAATNIPAVIRGMFNYASARRGDTWKRHAFGCLSESTMDYARFHLLHILHAGEKDPTQVAYYPSCHHLLLDRPQALKAGKYLNKYFGDTDTALNRNLLSPVQIRTLAEKHVMAYAPVELHLVPNTDPDGWEWVYEHGTGFNSCMVYDRSGRYLDDNAHSLNHPVRAYAYHNPKHPDRNHLALAWIGDKSKFKTDARVVAARVIVNTKTMTYARIYGDYRIQNALIQAGFKDGEDRDSTMSGQYIRSPGYTNSYHKTSCYLPYLDWGNAVPTSEDLVFVVEDDPSGFDTNSDGITNISPKYFCNCDHCGDEIEDEDDAYSACDGNVTVCESCRDNYYVEAHTRYGTDYFHADDCIECQSDGEYYYNNSRTLNAHNIVETEDGDYYFADDVATTHDGRVYPESETVTVNGVIYHVNDDDIPEENEEQTDAADTASV